MGYFQGYKLPDVSWSYKDLSLKLLTLKTVMLCALVSAQREQTLCALD